MNQINYLLLSPTFHFYNYNYDPINRLVNVSKNNSENTWYDFDPMGNRLKKRMSGTVEKVENYDYNACDELRCMDGTIFEFDMNGNMTKKTAPSEGTTEYTYNYNNRLFKINYPDNTNSRYFYNSAGLRIKKTDKTGKTTYYYWDETNIDSIPNAINESDSSGNITNIYRPGTGFKSIYNNNEWRFFITDSLGSVIALTDNNGNITDRYEYDEYGKPVSSSGNSYNPYRYIEQEFDDNSQLIYLRARHYSPNPARFITRDPIGIDGGSNVYLYANDNPISFLDLTGMGYVSVGHGHINEHGCDIWFDFNVDHKNCKTKGYMTVTCGKLKGGYITMYYHVTERGNGSVFNSKEKEKVTEQLRGGGINNYPFTPKEVNVKKGHYYGTGFKVKHFLSRTRLAFTIYIPKNIIFFRV